MGLWNSFSKYKYFLSLGLESSISQNIGKTFVKENIRKICFLKYKKRFFFEKMKEISSERVFLAKNVKFFFIERFSELRPESVLSCCKITFLCYLIVNVSKIYTAKVNVFPNIFQRKWHCNMKLLNLRFYERYFSTNVIKIFKLNSSNEIYSPIF